MSGYYPIDLPGEHYMRLNQHLNEKEYVKICKELKKDKYDVITASEALELHDRGNLQIKDKVRIIWIHDIESPSDNWLAEEMARLENEFGFRSTYNIRIFCALTEELRKPLRKIVKLGGEMGYQYEDLVTTKGDVKKARGFFSKNLSLLRKYFKIDVIFAHGVWLSGIDATKQFYQDNDWDPSLWIKCGIHKNGELYYFGSVLKKEFGGKFYYCGEPTCIGGDEFVVFLRKKKTGDIVLFLQHPMHWTNVVDVGRLKKFTRGSSSVLNILAKKGRFT